MNFEHLDTPRGDWWPLADIEVVPGEHGTGVEVPARRLDWIVVGGESGPGARPCNVEWIRSVVRQCQGTGTACFVKQLGANVWSPNDTGWEGLDEREWPCGTDVDEASGEEWQGAPIRVLLGDRRGGDLDEWPEDLRVRQYPA